MKTTKAVRERLLAEAAQRLAAENLAGARAALDNLRGVHERAIASGAGDDLIRRCAEAVAEAENLVALREEMERAATERARQAWIATGRRPLTLEFHATIGGD